MPTIIPASTTENAYQPILDGRMMSCSSKDASQALTFLYRPRIATLPERTIHYKTYLKTALVEGLRDVFIHHIDDPLRKTKVTIEWPTTRDMYPTIIVRFFERNIVNAGVGHVEYIVRNPDEPVERHFVDRFKHYFYKGDIEFAIFALTSYDRDIVSDSLVQTLGMGDLLNYTNRFLDRIYNPAVELEPDSLWNYVNVNTDEIQGFGEAQVPVPWGTEDELVYQTAYRVAVFGEFYSLPPTTPIGYIRKVNFYPYIKDMEPVPEGTDDPAPWGTGEAL